MLFKLPLKLASLYSAIIVPVFVSCLEIGPPEAFGQKPDALAPMTNEQSMRAEQAHKALFDTPVGAAERARLTAHVRKNLPSGATCGPIRRKNLIDDYVFDRMERDRVPHACLSTDEEFLRRVTLDLTGQIPDADPVREFVKDRQPDKRERVIDSLIGSEMCVDRWTYYYTALFHLSRGGLGSGVDLFNLWLREQFKSNRPYDQMIRDMLTMSGKYNALGQAGTSFYLINNVYEKEFVMQEDTDDERTVTIFSDFLGMNLSCISCHDGAGHVDKINLWLSRRKREQFWQEAAFLGKTHTVLHGSEFEVNDLGPGYNMREHSIARPPRYGGPPGPAFILTGEKPHPGKDPREEMARLITAHPQFARAAVNRFWDHFMGMGLVEPIDGFDPARLDPRNPPPKPWTIQPSNPELLEALSNDFRSHGYNLRRLFKLITESSAYQLSSDFRGEWKDSYANYYARKLARPLGAEELYDAIVKATEVADNIVKYSGQQNDIAGGGELDFTEKASQRKVKYVMDLSTPEDMAGKELGGVRYWLSAFGLRKGATSPSLLQPMLLMNHDVVKKRITDGHSYLARLLESNPPLSDEKLIEDLFLRTLSRYPHSQEVALLSGQLKSGDRQAAAQDIEWVLLNKLDFIFNY